MSPREPAALKTAPKFPLFQLPAHKTGNNIQHTVLRIPEVSHRVYLICVSSVLQHRRHPDGKQYNRGTARSGDRLRTVLIPEFLRFPLLFHKQHSVGLADTVGIEAAEVYAGGKALSIPLY